jgi:hypothetical protein
MSRSNRSTLPLLLGGLALALVIGSCTEDAAGPSPREAPAFKRGGGPGGGPGTDADPVVAAVDPDSASQDTTIDVLVLGEGFDDGSTATWLIDELPDPLDRIHTNRTTYVNPKRLIANITIAADAETTLYDVEVKTSKGRKGVGIEVFRVKVKAEPIPVEATLRDDESDGVRSDDLGSYAAEIDENGNLFLDARVATERQICLDFAGQAGAPYDDLPGADVCDAAWISTFDPYENGGLQTLGLTSTRPVRLGVSWVKDRYNWALVFGRDCETGELVPDDLAVASATGADTWEIEAGYATLCRSPTRGKPRTEYVGRFAMPVHLQLVRVSTP